jgi:hypothetical protein
MQRWIERSLAHLEHALGELLDALGDGVAVGALAGGESAQD